jgi:hypothetical protein
MSVLLCDTGKCVKKNLSYISIKKPKEAACDEPKGMERISHIAKTMRNCVVNESFQQMHQIYFLLYYFHPTCFGPSLAHHQGCDGC